MSDHDDDRAFAQLDARGRQAAASLKTALADIVCEPTWSRNGQDGSRFATDSVHRLSGPPAARRNVWLAAAVILAVVGRVAAFLALGGPDEADVTSGEEETGTYLVPGWLPDGAELTDAEASLDNLSPHAEIGEIVVYGDGSLDDPWSGPTLSITRANAPSYYGDGPEEATTVGDRPATLHDDDGDVVAVTWTTADGMEIAVVGNGLPRDAVVSAAGLAGVESADVAELLVGYPRARDAAEVTALLDGFQDPADGPALRDDGLPGGFVELARAPSLGMGESNMLGDTRLSYELPGGMTVGISQVPGEPDDLQLHRLPQSWPRDLAMPFVPDEVRGQPAFSREAAVHESEGVGVYYGPYLRWYEESTGMIVTLTGSPAGGDRPALDMATLKQVADGLQPQATPEVEEALVRFGPFGPLEDGEFLVAEGTNNGDRWQVIANIEDIGPFLSVESTRGGDAEGSGYSNRTYDDIFVNTAEATVGGDILIYGTVTDEATELVLVRPEGQEIVVRLYPVDLPDWPATQAFAEPLPHDVIKGASLVARDADGNVVAEAGQDDLGDTFFDPDTSFEPL